MKSRIVIAIIFLLMGLMASAKAPDLQCEKAFDRALLKNPSVSMQISNHPLSYYRRVSVSGDKAMVKRIIAWVEADSKKAFGSVDSSDDEFHRSLILNIDNDGKTINVGLKVLSEDTCTLFVEGVPEAFK